MSSIFDNPTFYISIFSSICFVASEALPFLPVKSNGIIHAIVQCLSSYDKNNKNITPNPLNSEDKILSKLDLVIYKIDKMHGVV